MRGAKGLVQREMWKAAVYDDKFAAVLADAAKDDPSAALKVATWVARRLGSAGDIASSPFQEPGEVQQTPARTNVIRSINTEIGRSGTNRQLQQQQIDRQDNYDRTIDEILGAPQQPQQPSVFSPGVEELLRELRGQ